MIDAGDVAAGPIEAVDEAQPDGVGAGGEDNGNCRGRRLGREHDWSASARDDHAHLPPDQIGRQCRQLVVLTFRPTVFDRHILAFDIAAVRESKPPPVVWKHGVAKMKPAGSPPAARRSNGGTSGKPAVARYDRRAMRASWGVTAFT
jgi:hypothetical protein